MPLPTGLTTKAAPALSPAPSNTAAGMLRRRLLAFAAFVVKRIGTWTSSEVPQLFVSVGQAATGSLDNLPQHRYRFGSGRVAEHIA